MSHRRQSVLMDARLLLGSRNCLDNDGVQVVRMRRAQSRCREQIGSPPCGARLAPPSGQQDRQQHREQVRPSTVQPPGASMRAG